MRRIFSICIFSIFLAGCSSPVYAAPVAPQIEQADPTPDASVTGTPPFGYPCVPDDTLVQTGEVEWVVDGDTVHVKIDGISYKVRYIGMNTPEVDQPGGDEATQFNLGLVQGQTVTLVKDISETDKYGRLLRFVIVGDTFVNYSLVRNGFAKAGTWEPDTACDELFRAAEDLARSEHLGIWK